MPTEIRDKTTWPTADVDPGLVLQRWGKKGVLRVEVAGPIHDRILKALEDYQTIAPDQYFVPFDRSFASKPFSENSQFIQIGSWEDGSEILAKRDVSDGRIYIAEIEDGDPSRPVVIADSFEEFLKKCWAVHEASLRHE
jgi:hypothetical protein